MQRGYMIMKYMISKYMINGTAGACQVRVTLASHNTINSSIQHK